MSSIVSVTLRLLLLLALACGPSDPLEEIRELHGAGRFAASIDPLRGIIDQDPSQTEATLLLGRALLRTGSAGLAVWPLRKAAEAPEYAVEAGLLLTEAMLESRTAHDAVNEIDRVLAIDPDNPHALVLRVDANRAAGNLEEALADIDRVLEKEPGNLRVLVTRVTALIALDRIDEAGAALDAARASFEGAAAEIASPMLARLCVARALFTLQKGDLETAERYYADCAEQFPTERIAVAEIVAYYDRIGRSQRASEILERAAAESETGPFPTLLARRLGALGEPEEEERLLREEAETHGSGLAWFVLADYYVEHDRLDEAIEAFERALSVSPGSSRLRFAYADTLVQAERFDEARKAARRLEKTELRSLIMGRILLGEGNARGALVAFEAGIRLWPNNAVARFLAGQASERVGDFPRAISHYRESFRTNPGISDAGRALAELYASQGLHDDALQIASRFVRGHARDPEAYLLSIRLAQAADRPRVIAEGLQRLSQLPEQAPVAAAEQASLFAAAGNAEAAVEAIEATALDLTQPENAIALRALIEQLGALGQYEKAVSLADGSLAAYPDEAVFHELQGRALSGLGQMDAARTGYERALALDASSWRAQAGLAALAAKVGDSSRALSLYDLAIAAAAEDATPALAAIALVRETDPEETARRLERLLDQHPRTASAANELAGIFADRGELERASNLASRAAWFRLPEAEATIARIEKLRGATAPATSDPVPQDEPSE
ncbi:MAG: tetratricopeptide repeat protein, partial [Deltaproteobacteria bacterium]|nr:tetratricopeptide repeat protein [Deltaproteobacteria bacterium]